MNKLAEFPLERSGLGDAPDETVIVAWPAWSLTVGDVRAAVASKEDTTPQHSVTEQASGSIRDDEAYRKLMAGLPLHQFYAVSDYLDSRAQPLESTAATQPEQAGADDLPPLPEPYQAAGEDAGCWFPDVFTNSQMYDYARAALTHRATTRGQ